MGFNSHIQAPTLALISTGQEHEIYSFPGDQVADIRWKACIILRLNQRNSYHLFQDLESTEPFL